MLTRSAGPWLRELQGASITNSTPRNITLNRTQKRLLRTSPYHRLNSNKTRQGEVSLGARHCRAPTFCVGQVRLPVRLCRGNVKQDRQECLSYSNRLRLAAVQIDQSALQQARLRRQHECGKIRNVLRFTQPHDIGFANMLFDGGINITAELRRLRFQQSSQPLRAHRSRIDRIYLDAIADAYIGESLRERHARAIDGTSDCKPRAGGAPSNADYIQHGPAT